jgi:hypothetical protein
VQRQAIHWRRSATGLFRPQHTANGQFDIHRRFPKRATVRKTDTTSAKLRHSRTAKSSMQLWARLSFGATAEIFVRFADATCRHSGGNLNRVQQVRALSANPELPE